MAKKFFNKKGGKTDRRADEARADKAFKKKSEHKDLVKKIDKKEQERKKEVVKSSYVLKAKFVPVMEKDFDKIIFAPNNIVYIDERGTERVFRKGQCLMKYGERTLVSGDCRKGYAKYAL